MRFFLGSDKDREDAEDDDSGDDDSGDSGNDGGGAKLFHVRHVDWQGSGQTTVMRPESMMPCRHQRQCWPWIVLDSCMRCRPECMLPPPPSHPSTYLYRSGPDGAAPARAG